MYNGGFLRVGVKKDDLNKITRKRLIDKADTFNTDSLIKGDIELRKMPYKVTIAYAIIGGLWVLFSDGILNIIVEISRLWPKYKQLRDVYLFLYHLL